jgi:hypothetical protein
MLVRPLPVGSPRQAGARPEIVLVGLIQLVQPAGAQLDESLVGKKFVARLFCSDTGLLIS